MGELIPGGANPFTMTFCLWASLEVWLGKARLCPPIWGMIPFWWRLLILAPSHAFPILKHFHRTQECHLFLGAVIIWYVCLFSWGNSVLAPIILNALDEDMGLLESAMEKTLQEGVSCLTTLLKVTLHFSAPRFSMTLFSPFPLPPSLPLPPPPKPTPQTWCSGKVCPWLSSHDPPFPSKSSRPHS